MNMALATAGIFLLLVLSELLWRRGAVRGELGRKFVHILVGTFVAFWPLWMTWGQIRFMSLAFLGVVILSWRFTLFHAVHGVKRKTLGELFFPMGIGLAACIAPSPIIFTAAILHLAVADGLAAVVGKQYGMLHQYKIGNYTKTLAGTCTFWVISQVIIVGAVVWGGAFAWPILPLVVLLPLVATVAENIGIMGTDNVLVPLVVVGGLQLLRIG